MPRADAELRERLLATFRVEAAEHLQALNRDLLALSDAPTSELVERAFREMHTLKGAARSVGLREIEHACQDCETLLSRLTRAGATPDAAQLRTLQSGVDAIARLAGSDGPKPEALAP